MSSHNVAAVQFNKGVCGNWLTLWARHFNTRFIFQIHVCWTQCNKCGCKRWLEGHTSFSTASGSTAEGFSLKLSDYQWLSESIWFAMISNIFCFWFIWSVLMSNHLEMDFSLCRTCYIGDHWSLDWCFLLRKMPTCSICVYRVFLQYICLVGFLRWIMISQ